MPLQKSENDPENKRQISRFFANHFNPKVFDFESNLLILKKEVI